LIIITAADTENLISFDGDSAWPQTNYQYVTDLMQASPLLLATSL
jgi:hypothetical protein